MTAAKTAAKRKRLRRPALPPADFAVEEKLLQEAARLTRAVAAFRADPATAARPPGRRLALMDELTQLLTRLKTAQAALGDRLRRGARAAGAMNAYARTGGMMKRR